MRTVSRTIPYCKGLLIISILFLCFQASGYAADVTLGWDANTEPDLDGYMVYYKTGSSGPPYTGTGATEGNSPIDVRNVMEFTLHGLSDSEVSFFVVTAYDDKGRESVYSNEVPPVPTLSGGGTEGGGGGCFVATAAFGLR